MVDVLVVGSGYGGSVIAARLAPRSRVVLVERGRWWRAGDFPRSIADLARTYMTRRNRTGLWAMRFGRGTGNAFASAFGGSSPVNYGITVQPDDEVFADWPIAAGELRAYFARALDVLRPEPNPIADRLGDKQFLDIVEPGRRYDLRNTIDWRRCINCGRCVPGCNVPGAKRSLDSTYLAIAMRAGAEVRLETEVRDLMRHPEGGFVVELCRTTGLTGSEWVRAKNVVIAAGTLGTLDILRRVSAHLPLSPMLGQRMSMNGDGLAFLYNTKHRLSGHSGAPISTSVRIPFVNDAGQRRTLMVMSGRVPMAAMRFAGAALSVAGGLIGTKAHATDREGRGLSWIRRLRDLGGVGEGGALSRSFMYKLDGQDDSRGTARFDAAGTVIDWQDYGSDPVVRFAEQRLEAWARTVGGVVIPNIAQLPGMRSFSVHPLGGARMGTSAETGVVDDVGRVFDPRGGIHPGLRVADGSIFAGSVGVPPSLTVAALAERIAESIVVV